MRRLGILVALLLSPALVACGDDPEEVAAPDPKSAADDYAETPILEIGDAALDAMKTVKTVRLRGRVSDEDGVITMDVRIGRAGACVGSMSIADKGGFKLLRTAGTDGGAYMKPDRRFWELNAGTKASAVIAAVGKRWVVTERGGFDKLCDLEQLLGSDDKGTSKDDKVIRTSVRDGVPVVVVSTRDDDDGVKTLVEVAATEPHYIVHIDRPKGEFLDLSEINEPVEVEEPAEKDTFAIN